MIIQCLNFLLGLKPEENEGQDCAPPMISLARTIRNCQSYQAMSLFLISCFMMIPLSFSFVPSEITLQAKRVNHSVHFLKRAGLVKYENYHRVLNDRKSASSRNRNKRNTSTNLSFVSSKFEICPSPMGKELNKSIRSFYYDTLSREDGRGLYLSSKTRLFSTSSQHGSELWEPITSTKNPTVKLFKNLVSKRRERKKKNLTVVEGHRLVMDMLSNPRASSFIQHILVSEQALNHADLGGRLEDLLLNLSPTQKVNIVSDDVLRACCDTITPQGVVATCSIPKPFSSRYFNEDASYNQPKLFLVLDGVSDPGNVGTLLRSSAAVGVTAVILLPDCTDVWAPKAIRSSMGASFHVPIVSVDGLDDCLNFLNECGCENEHFYAATMDVSDGSSLSENKKSSPAHYKIDWVEDASSESSRVSALCIGKEGPGLSMQVRDAVSNGKIRSVHVPMEETGVVESLNAAVCGSVVLFEFSRQKRNVKDQRSD